MNRRASTMLQAAAAYMALAWAAGADARVGGGHSYSSGSRSSSSRPSSYRPSSSSHSSSSSTSSSSSRPSTPPPPTRTYAATDPGPVPGFDPSVLTCPSDACKDPQGPEIHRRPRSLGWTQVRPWVVGGVGLLAVLFGAWVRRRRGAPAVPGGAGLVGVAERVAPHDPTFSPVLFLDFVVLLYVRSMETRGGDMAEVAPYFRAEVLQALVTGGPRGASDVVVGAARIETVTTPGDLVALTVALEASHQTSAGAAWRSELWTFSHRRGVSSRDPDAILRLGCPSCGAAAELSPEGRCPACSAVVNRGDHAWVVTAVQIRESRALDALATRPDAGGDEPGTRLPTVVQPDLAARLRALQARRPDFAWERFVPFVEATFLELQAAWSSLAWERARALETDALYQTHRFWIERYRRQGLRNELRDPVIEGVELAAVGQDAWYDTVTVRVRARMIDVTVDATGAVKGGNATTPKRFTEYWTFVRRTGMTGEGPQDRGACPSCGAPLRISAAGICAHCGSKITTGAFGWVLAAIQQDEAVRAGA